MAKDKSVTTGAKVAKTAAAKTTAGKSGAKAAPPRKPAATKSAAVVKEAAKPAAKPRTRAARPKARAIGADQRRNYVEVAAYYIAERRGFAPGDSLQDWIAAEAEIDRLLAEGLLGG